MFKPLRLATVSPRQLEQLLASTPAFLLPSFASVPSSSTSTAPQRRRNSSLSSSDSTRKPRGAGKSLEGSRSRAKEDALGVGTSRSGQATSVGQTRTASTSAAAVRWQEVEEDEYEEVEERSERREGKGVEGLGDKLHRMRGPTEEERSPSLATTTHPSPPPPPINRFAFAEPSLSSASATSASATSSSPPRSIPPNPFGISTRGELMKLLARIPPSAPLDHFLSLQSLLRTIHRMDDSRPVAALASAAIRADTPQIGFARRLLKQALKQMKDSATPPSNPSWVLEGPIRILVQRRQWEQVVGFTNVAVSQDIASVKLIEWRLKAMYELRRYPEAVEAFGLFSNHRVKPTGDAYDDLVGAQLLNANLPAAQAALADKAERDFPTTVKTCLALLDGMWMFGGNKVMEQRVLEEENRKVLRTRAAMCQDVKVLNRIMSVRASRGDHEDAFAVLPYFNLDANPRLGHSLRSHATTIAPNPSLSDTDPAPPPHDFYRPTPDLATIVILMGTFLRLRRTDLASSLFADSQLAGLGLNEYLVATFVRTHLAEGDLEGAEDFIFALARGEAVVGRPQLCEEREEGQDPIKVQLERFQPSAMIYEVLLGGVLRYRGLQGAAGLLERMAASAQNQSIEVTEGMVAALVEYVAIERGEEPRTSAELIVRMYELSARRRKPTVSNLNKLLEATWRNERWSAGARGAGGKKEAPWALRRAFRKAEAREKLMPSAFIEPASSMTADPTSIPQLFTPPQRTSTADPPTLLDPLDRIHSSLRDRRTQPDRSTTQHHLRSASSPSINSMWDYLQTSLIDRGIRPTHAHLSIILRAYIRLGDPSGAHETLQRSFDQLGVEPHVSLYSVLIGGLSKLGMWDQAMNVYKEMQERGIQPDRAMFATLALGAARKRDVQGVQRVWDEAARRLVKSDSDAATGQDDIRLHPIFISIMYRALVTSGRILEAQELVASSLEKGMKPDAGTLMVLQRTRRWLKWKVNKSKVPWVTALSTSQHAVAESADSESALLQQLAVKATQLNRSNLRRVRSALRQARPAGKGGLKELQKLEPFLARRKRVEVRLETQGRKGRRRKVPKPSSNSQ